MGQAVVGAGGGVGGVGRVVWYAHREFPIRKSRLTIKASVE